MDLVPKKKLVYFAVGLLLISSCNIYFSVRPFCVHALILFLRIRLYLILLSLFNTVSNTLGRKKLLLHERMKKKLERLTHQFAQLCFVGKHMQIFFGPVYASNYYIFSWKQDLNMWTGWTKNLHILPAFPSAHSNKQCKWKLGCIVFS